MIRFFLLAAAMLAAFGVTDVRGQSVDTAESLQLSVRRLDAWLGNGIKAEGWRRALWLAALESQSAQGHAADPALLRQILNQFEAGYAGLEHPQFVETRSALTAHLNQIESASGRDMASLLASARTGFRAVTAGQVDVFRSEAQRHLQRMKQQYLGRLPAEVRDPLFTKIDLAGVEQQLVALDLAKLLPGGVQPAVEAVPPMPSEDTENEDERKARQEAEKVRQDELARLADRDRNAERTRVLRALLTSVRQFEDAALEHPDIWFQSATVALDRFVRVLAAATSTRTDQETYESIDSLEQNLPLLASGTDSRAAIAVGDALGRLAHALQATELVAAVRRRHALPNFQLDLAASLLTAAANRSNADTRPVDELILGRQILGSANTSTQVTVDLLNDPHQVSASIHLNGQIQSQTYTRQGPITAYAASSGPFEGRRSLYANIGGFYVTDPYVAANLQSTFGGVDCRLRLVQRIANKQYLRDKTTAEGIAAARAERRIMSEFTEQTDQALVDARKNFAEAQPTLYNWSRWVPDLALSSSPRTIRAIATKADPARIAASTAPLPGRLPADVRLTIHQSAIGNYLDPILSGQQFTNEELGELFKDLMGEVPGAFQQKDASESWSITFPPTGAVIAEFRDQKANLQITGRRFSQEDREIDATLIIRIEFQIVHRNGELWLVQTGKPTVDYADPSQKDARVVGFKSFLEGKLEAGFDPAAGGFKLPGNLIPLDRIQRQQLLDIASRLALMETRLEQGWLALAWNQSDGSTWISQADTPAIHASPVLPSAPPPSPEPEQPAEPPLTPEETPAATSGS